MKFNDLVRMMLVYLWDNRKGETKEIVAKNKALFNESTNKGVMGLLSDWRQKYGIFDLNTINRKYSMTQIKWIMNEIKQNRIQFLEQLDTRVLAVPKSHATGYAKLADKCVNWKYIQKCVDYKDMSALKSYLSK